MAQPNNAAQPAAQPAASTAPETPVVTPATVVQPATQVSQEPATTPESLPAVLQPDTVVHQPVLNSSFADSASFEHAQRVAKALSASGLVPKEYQGNIPNTMIALELANRINASPIMVMQNLNIIHGKPSWGSSFIIGAINATKRFSPLRFDKFGEGDEQGCLAWARDSNGDRLEGSKVTIAMAKKEGWWSKNGSKWPTMPDLMLMYRAAAFFGRLYAPDILMGMQTTEEVADVQVADAAKATNAANVINALKNK